VVDFPACAVDAPHIRQRLYWAAIDMAHADRSGRAGRQEAQERSTLGRVVTERADDHSAVCDAFLPRLEGQRRDGDGAGRWPVEAGPASSPDGRNGTHWSDAEWITCHDGKARRAQPGVRLLVDGLPRRVDLWRVAGNAIVVPAAREVIAALMDVLDWRDAA
jgi:DNA (cytosine-5)-methyltransferase 1